MATLIVPATRQVIKQDFRNDAAEGKMTLPTYVFTYEGMAPGRGGGALSIQDSRHRFWAWGVGPAHLLRRSTCT